MVPGELSIVTGVPNSGKSEWIDALLCNLAEQCGWSFALCSMEKKVSMRSVPMYMRMSTMSSTTYPTCSATHIYLRLLCVPPRHTPSTDIWPVQVPSPYLLYR